MREIVERVKIGYRQGRDEVERIRLKKKGNERLKEQGK